MTTGNPAADIIIAAKLGNATQSLAAGAIYQGRPSSQMVGSYTASVAAQATAYGYRNPDSSKAPTIGVSLPVQATNYMKKVKLVGYVNNSVVFEASTWMRVYKEIYAPSLDSRYRTYVDSSLGLSCENPCLPFIANSGVIYEGNGSILRQKELFPNGFTTTGSYQLLWLRWKSGEYERGVLFDWFYVPTDPDLRANASLDITPATSSNISKSGSKSFASTAINSYSSNGKPGVNLGTITGEPNIEYYLQDDPSEPAPKLQSSIGTTASKTIQLIEGPIALSGPDNVSLVDNLPITSKPTVQPGDLARVSSAGQTTQLEYVGIVGKIGGKWEPLYFDLETSRTIETHIKNAQTQASAAQFATTGGKQIVRTGALQNYVVPNYKFGSQPQQLNYWTPAKGNDGTFLPTVIVDGDNLNGDGAFFELLGGEWITGYAPPANPTTNDLNAARANYYYILPLQKRKTGGTTSAIFTGDENVGVTTDFTSSNAPWARSLHWGKFLKSSVNASRGFTVSQLDEYRRNLAIEAGNAVNERLAGTRFTGYVLRSTYYNQKSISDTVQVSLRNVTGIAISLGVRGFGSSSTAAITTPGSSATTPTDPIVTPSGTNPGPPKDWNKIITDAAGKLINPSSVQSLTQPQLQKFLRQQVNLGAPLSTLRSVFFTSLLNAKVASLQQTQGLSKKAATEAVKQDPLYLALQSFAKGLTPKSTATTGGTASNATATGGDPNATKTIKINVIRGLPGYRQGIRESSIADQPELVQTYEVYRDGVTAGDTPPRRFVFPFVPREVNYSGIGTRWTEIERTGNYPIVDWNGFQLLKISFNFDVVDRRFESVPGFGLHYSCEEQIAILREMAQTPYPVTFLNMDKFMRDEVRWPSLQNGRGIEFVIAEFTVTAVQRTSSGTTRAGGVVPNQISRATCSMTLQEIPIENVSIVQMPPIRPCKKNCTDIPKIPREKFKEYLLLSTGTDTSRG